MILALVVGFVLMGVAIGLGFLSWHFLSRLRKLSYTPASSGFARTFSLFTGSLAIATFVSAVILLLVISGKSLGESTPYHPEPINTSAPF